MTSVTRSKSPISTMAQGEVHQHDGEFVSGDAAPKQHDDGPPAWLTLQRQDGYLHDESSFSSVSQSSVPGTPCSLSGEQPAALRDLSLKDLKAKKLHLQNMIKQIELKQQQDHEKSIMVSPSPAMLKKKPETPFRSGKRATPTYP